MGNTSGKEFGTVNNWCLVTSNEKDHHKTDGNLKREFEDNLEGQKEIRLEVTLTGG